MTHRRHTDVGCVLHQEVDLLEHAASIPRDQRQQGPRPPPPDVMQHLLGAASNLQGQRQNLQSQVFRPTVALPTVSVEQQVAVSNHMIVIQTTCRCQATWFTLIRNAIFVATVRFAISICVNICAGKQECDASM